MRTDFEVVVVGAGPAGAAAALCCCRAGLAPVALLEQDRLPKHKPCGGGLSPRARRILGRLGLWEPVRQRAYAIRGLRLVSPSGRETLLAGAETASVLCRAEFDAILIDAAVQAGARFMPGTRVDGILSPGGRDRPVVVRAGGETLTTRWVIAADGARARFTHDRRPRRILATCMGWFEGVSFTPHVVEMIVQPAWMPHYGWLFPEADRRVNLGICVEAERLRRRSIRDLFRFFLDRHLGRRLAGARQVGGLRSHPIVTTVGIGHRAAPGVLVVGEANRLTNAATGEGIAYAMESGRLAAEAIRTARERRVDTRAAAAWYERRLRLTFGPAFALAELYRLFGVRMLDGVTRLGGLAGVNRLSGAALARL